MHSELSQYFHVLRTGKKYLKNISRPCPCLSTDNSPSTLSPPVHSVHVTGRNLGTHLPELFPMWLWVRVSFSVPLSEIPELVSSVPTSCRPVVSGQRLWCPDKLQSPILELSASGICFYALLLFVFVFKCFY